MEGNNDASTCSLQAPYWLMYNSLKYLGTQPATCIYAQHAYTYCCVVHVRFMGQQLAGGSVKMHRNFHVHQQAENAVQPQHKNRR